MRIIRQDATQLVARENNAAAFWVAWLFIIVAVGLPLVANAAHGTGSVYLISGIFAVIAIIILVVRKKIRLTLDKTTSQAEVAIQGVIGGSTQSYALGQITKIQLTSWIGTSINAATAGTAPYPSTQTERFTRLLLVLADGSSVDLSNKQQGIGWSTFWRRPANQKIGQQIAAFLGVPFEETSSSGLVGQPSATAPFRQSGRDEL